MGREWEGIGRGIRSRPPNIPPWGEGGDRRRIFAQKTKRKIKRRLIILYIIAVIP